MRDMQAAVFAIHSEEHWPDHEVTALSTALSDHPDVRAFLITSHPEPQPAPTHATLLLPHDLSFDADEILPHCETLEEADAVYTRTLGWPELVVRLLGEKTLAPRQRSARLDATHEIQDLLRRELLPWIPTTWTPALKYLAVAGSATVCELELAGSPAAIISALLQHGLATRTEQVRTPVISLSTELRELLLTALNKDTAELATVHSTIADARIQLGVLDGGLGSAYALRDWERCGRSLDQHWMRQLFLGSFDLVQEAVSQLPESVIDQYPRVAQLAELNSRRQLGKTPIQIPTSPRSIAHVSGKKAIQEHLEIASLAVTTRRTSGKIQDAIAIIEHARPLTENATQFNFAPGLGFGSYYHVQTGLAFHVAGEYARARREYQTGWRMRAYDGLGFVEADLAVKQAVLAAFDGDVRNAKIWVDRFASAERRSEWSAQHVNLQLEHAERMIALDALEPEFLAHWRDGAEAALALDELWPFRLWVEVRVAIISGAAHGALILIDDAVAAHPKTSGSDGIHRHMVDKLRAEAHLALGHGTPAAALLADSTLPGALIARIRLHLLAGDAEEANRQCIVLRARGDLSPRDTTELALLSAAVSTELGLADAAEMTRRAAAFAESRNDPRALWSLPASAQERLAVHSPWIAKELARGAQSGLHPYPEQVSLIELTQREREVLDGLTRNMSVDALADSFVVSRNTIKSQRRAIYAKLGVSSREDAISAAGALGLNTHHSFANVYPAQFQ